MGLLKTRNSLPGLGQEPDDFVRQIYLLVASFLLDCGHQNVAESLIRECQERNLLPISYNWKGQRQESSFSHIMKLFRNEHSPSLEVLLRRLMSPKINQSIQMRKNIFDLISLSVQNNEALLPISTSLEGKISEIQSLFHPIQGGFSNCLPWSVGFPWADNLLSIVATRYTHLKTITGHLLPAYCVLFDKSDRRIITGGDDGIVKVWCATSGVLLYSLRSHSNCISDLSIDPSNTVLAVGSIDGYITFWDLRLGYHLFTINAFSPILTLEFKPVENASRELILMSTCSDGYAKFWAVNLQQRSFTHSPIKFHCKSLARDEIRCASFSPGGIRFITGATDGIVRLFSVPEVSDIKGGGQPPIMLPYVQYLEEHEGYVNSVHFSSRGTEFVTSSWDGCVRQWSYDRERKCWSSEPFDTNTVLGDSQDGVIPGRPRKVTIVTYCNNDESFVAAVNQTHELILFDAKKRQNGTSLRYHQGEVYILTTNPVDDRIVLSAGCDGQAALWDMQTAKRTFEFKLENTRFLDGGFSQNGSMFALVDDLGRISVFGCGMSPDMYMNAPASQFFPTDWNELIFDSQRNAIDSVTQRPPHLVPRNQIVSIEKLPYRPIVSEAYPLEIPIDGEEGIIKRQQHLYLRQAENEKYLLQQELDNTPPGSIPKHTRSRRRRLLYGSDVEEDEVALTNEISPINTIPGTLVRGGGRTNPLEGGESEDEPFQMVSDSETDAEISVTTNSDDEVEAAAPLGHYNFRRRPGGTEVSPQGPNQTFSRLTRSRVVSELDGNDQLYRPIISSTRSTPRRRPIITESSEGESPVDSQQSFHQQQHSTIIPRSLEVSPWLTMRDRRMFPYLPQLYDVVAYFIEGHRMFLKREKGGIFNENLPWQVEEDLESVVFGQVISLNLFPGPQTWCLIEMLLLSRAEAQEVLPPPLHVPSTARRIQISFYDMENQPDFVIPFCRYNWSVQPMQWYRPGEIVRVIFGQNEAYEARIQQLRVPAECIPERPWQCYVVEWLALDDEPEALSPWELETIFEEDAPERRSYNCGEHIEMDILCVIEEGLRVIMNDPRSGPFRHPVNFNNFPDYLKTVAYPIDLELLHERVLNGYYRRIEALEWDTKLLYENAFAYNLPDSEIVQDAEYIVNEIMRLIKRAERRTRRLPRRSQPETTPVLPITPRMSRSAAAREERARRRAALDLRHTFPEEPATTTTNTSTGTGTPFFERSLRSRTLTLVAGSGGSTPSPTVTSNVPKRRRVLESEDSADSSNDEDFEQVIGGSISNRPRRRSPRTTNHNESPSPGVAARLSRHYLRSPRHA